MRKTGRRLSAAEPLERSRQRARGELERLPEALKRLERGPDYPVVVSEALRKLARKVDAIGSRSAMQEASSEQPLIS
jgi:nicotinate phosphoribosyltransferase